MNKPMCAAVAFAMLAAFGGCAGTPSEPPDTAALAQIVPVVYDNDEVKQVEDSEAGNIDDWAAEVFTKNGGNNDEATNNSIVKSPWHKLAVNGVEVPVYTARCGKGPHSFAWVDVVEPQENFKLEVELTMHRAMASSVVLPQKHGVVPALEGKTVKSVVRGFGSFTYTFSLDPNAKTTDPRLAPLTLIVAPEEKLEVPFGYDVIEIEAGFHENDALEFTEENVYYVFKAGLHDISSVNIPSNSVIWLERGAYLKCYPRYHDDGLIDTQPAVHARDSENPALRGRGLLDTGSLPNGTRTPVLIVNCQKPVISGLTIINSDSWTLDFYDCDDGLMERNVLLGYRTYSDGLMMSECRNCTARYNFVRTGDDALEVKGTGWNGGSDGSHNLFEYNDCWSDKGICYGLPYECTFANSDIIFRNNSVGFAQANWKADFNGVLDIYMGTKSTTRWGDIYFQNIEIYHADSQQVMHLHLGVTGGVIDNVHFEDISVHSVGLGVYALTMQKNADGAITNIHIKNFNFCGRMLTEADKSDKTVMRFAGSGVSQDEVTVS